MPQCADQPAPPVVSTWRISLQESSGLMTVCEATSSPERVLHYQPLLLLFKDLLRVFDSLLYGMHSRLSLHCCPTSLPDMQCHMLLTCTSPQLEKDTSVIKRADGSVHCHLSGSHKSAGQLRKVHKLYEMSFWVVLLLIFGKAGGTIMIGYYVGLRSQVHFQCHIVFWWLHPNVEFPGLWWFILIVHSANQTPTQWHDVSQTPVGIYWVSPLWRFTSHKEKM